MFVDCISIFSLCIASKKSLFALLLNRFDLIVFTGERAEVFMKAQNLQLLQFSPLVWICYSDGLSFRLSVVITALSFSCCQQVTRSELCVIRNQ